MRFLDQNRQPNPHESTSMHSGPQRHGSCCHSGSGKPVLAQRCFNRFSKPSRALFFLSMFIAPALPMSSVVNSQTTSPRLAAAQLNSETPPAVSAFVIESSVHIRQENAPVSRNRTLFSSSLVVDYAYHADAEQPYEVTLFDVPTGRVTRVDADRGISCQVSDEELLQLLRLMQQDPQLRSKLDFLIQPEFDIERTSNSIELSSDRLRYLCTGQQVADRPQQMQLYYDFLDQLTRLSAADPQKLPPFSRLELNRQLREHQLMPQSVEFRLQLPQEFGNRKIELVSKHSVEWQPGHNRRTAIAICDRTGRRGRESFVGRISKSPLATNRSWSHPPGADTFEVNLRRSTDE